MRVCIPTESDDGLSAMVYGHFGSAPFFTIVDTDSNSVEVVDNGKDEHEHGHCQPLQPLLGKEVDCLVVAGIGRRALQILQGNGLQVLQARPGTVGDICAAAAAGELPELGFDDACGGHAHGGGGCAH